MNSNLRELISINIENYESSLCIDNICAGRGFRYADETLQRWIVKKDTLIYGTKFQKTNVNSVECELIEEKTRL